MAKKLTWMVLKVDLGCSDCYKDVKKILCQFPEIQVQAFDNQRNEVRITVNCCSPEKIRDKLCSKGGKVIKSIQIIDLPKATNKPERTSSSSAAATAPPATRTPEASESVPASAIPPGVALGIPVPDNYYRPFPSGFRCPVCGYPCLHGFGKIVPPPPYT